MKRLLHALGLMVVLSLSTFAAHTQTLPDWVSPHLNDFAGVIDPDAAVQIVAELISADIDPGVEIAAVTLRSRHDFAQGSTLEGFAKDLFNHWAVGDTTRNDGILIVVLTEDREVRIALGRAYSPVYDGRAQRVIDALILPEFQAGNYGAGVLAGAIGARDHIARPLREGAEVTADSGLPPVPSTGFPWEFAGFAALIAAVFGFMNRGRIGDSITRRRPCPSCGKMGVEILRETKANAIIRRHCPHCEWTHDRIDTSVTADRNDNGPDRNDFGGGSSSGGGASGRW